MYELIICITYRNYIIEFIIFIVWIRIHIYMHTYIIYLCKLYILYVCRY